MRAVCEVNDFAEIEDMSGLDGSRFDLIKAATAHYTANAPSPKLQADPSQLYISQMTVHKPIR